MKPRSNDAIERMVAVLNGDILREIRMADTCIRQADCLQKEYHPVVQRQMALCAAAALANATALAAEVLVLGGVPVDPGVQLREGPAHSRPVQGQPGAGSSHAGTLPEPAPDGGETGAAAAPRGFPADRQYEGMAFGPQRARSGRRPGRQIFV